MEAMVAWWSHYLPVDDLLVVATGREEDFCALRHPHKVFLRDSRLETRDHQRERQSYSGFVAAVARWLHGEGGRAEAQPSGAFRYVHLAEYDHVPLSADFNALQVAASEREGAGVLGYAVARVDGTSNPHYLYHAAEPEFHRFWERISERADKDVVLSMLGTGSLWTRAAFEAVAAVPEPFPIYLELYLPTLAHHLGYRVRAFRSPLACGSIHIKGDLCDEIPAAKSAGAWSIHPVKSLWDRPAIL